MAQRYFSDPTRYFSYYGIGVQLFILYLFIATSTIFTMEKKIHQGRNIKRFREMLGIKQEGLALELGDDWNQRKVSMLEQREEIESDILKQVAEVLKVPVAAIENFDEEAAIVNIQNNYENSNSGSGTIGNNLNYHHCTFNPMDKVMELFERLLESEKEKTRLMKEILDKMK